MLREGDRAALRRENCLSDSDRALRGTVLEVSKDQERFLIRWDDGTETDWYTDDEVTSEASI
jgi:hypothetical protein